MSWCDIGVNLTSSRYADPELVLRQAADADVRQIICIGTDVEESTASCSLARQYQGLYATAGVHPHYAKDVAPDYLQQIKQLAQQPEVIAIGECGLDFNRNFSPAEQQLKVFEQQLQLAVELQLPVFLHERDAFEQQIELLNTYRSQLVGGVVHCFTGNEQQLQAYLELDLYIGVTGWLCDPKRAGDLRQAIQHLPLERLMLETDAPYLLPKSIRPRPKNNHPMYLPVIAQEIANILEIELEKIQQHSYSNAKTLFNLHS